MKQQHYLDSEYNNNFNQVYFPSFCFAQMNKGRAPYGRQQLDAGHHTHTLLGKQQQDVVDGEKKQYIEDEGEDSINRRKSLTRAKLFRIPTGSTFHPN